MAPSVRVRALACLVASLIGGCSFLKFPDPELVEIELTAPASFPAGVNKQLSAVGKFNDGQTKDLTAEVTWESSSNEVAQVSSAGVITGISAGSATIRATDPGTAIVGSVVITIDAAPLVSIALTPDGPSVPLGATVQFAATGTFGNGTTHDLTTNVVWSSSVSAIASFGDAPGLASTGTVGTTRVVAFHEASRVSGSTNLTVTSAQLVSIGVTPTTPSVPLGVPQQFTATGTYTNGTTQDITGQVAWSSSAGTVASVSDSGPSKGRASTVGTGTTTIQATDPTTHVAGSTTLTVTAAQLASIAITPPASSVPLGLSRQLTATGTYTDGRTQNLTALVTWGSSDGAVATISNAPGSTGLAASVAPGTIVVEARYEGISGTTTLSVTAAELTTIGVTPTAPSVPLGLTRQFTATGTYTNGTTQDLTGVVTWSSSSGSVATISNAGGSKGLASTAGIGSSAIQATHAASGVSGSTTLTVTAARVASIAITPAAPSIPLGLSRQLTATGTFTDGKTQDLTAAVTWGSSDGRVAALSNAAGSKGLATSVALGTTVVDATDPGTGVSGTTPLTVTAAELTAIAVTPSSASVPLGLTQQFTATGTYTDGTTQNLTTAVTWESSRSGVASVSNAAGSIGLATSASTGSTTIRATAAGGAILGEATLTVTPARLEAITVTPASASIAVGATQQFVATGSYSDGSTPVLASEVVWGSSQPAVAEISNANDSRGLATGLAAGTTTIEAVAGGVRGAATIEVTAPVVTEPLVTGSAAP